MGRKAKSASQKIREMTDAGYRPREIHKKLGGQATISTVYTVRDNYKKKQAKEDQALEDIRAAVFTALDRQPTTAPESMPEPAPEPTQPRDYAFELTVPDKPSLWVRVKHWFGFGQ
jgi:hypothetical protein